MSDNWRRVRLSDVARLDTERISVKAGMKYSGAGVLNAARGVFPRGDLSGDDTRYQHLHVLRSEIGRASCRERV